MDKGNLIYETPKNTLIRRLFVFFMHILVWSLIIGNIPEIMKKEIQTGIWFIICLMFLAIIGLSRKVLHASFRIYENGVTNEVEMLIKKLFHQEGRFISFSHIESFEPSPRKQYCILNLKSKKKVFFFNKKESIEQLTNALKKNSVEIKFSEKLPKYFSQVEMDPSKLKWISFYKMTSKILVLNMFATQENASLPLVNIHRTDTYPTKEIPEVKGLIRVLDRACRTADLEYQLIKGSREMKVHSDFEYYEPYLIQLPFTKAKLSLHIDMGPAQFQWILKNFKKEKPSLANQLEILKQELLKETKEWIKRGNR